MENAAALENLGGRESKLCSYQYYARGGGPRDEVGTLNVRAHPTWGILANFEHNCWPRDREV